MSQLSQSMKLEANRATTDECHVVNLIGVDLLSTVHIAQITSSVTAPSKRETSNTVCSRRHVRRTAFKCENTDSADLHTSTNHVFIRRWLTGWANTRNIWQLPVLLLSPPAPSVNRFPFRRHPHSAATCPSFHHFTTNVPLGFRLLSPLRTLSLSLSLPLDHSLFLLMFIHSACPDKVVQRVGTFAL